MAKKTQGTDTKRHDIAVPPENRQPDKRPLNCKQIVNERLFFAKKYPAF